MVGGAGSRQTRGRSRDGTDPGGEGVGRARRPECRGRTRPPLHRPPPHPRGDLAAGVRRPAPRRSDRAPPGPDARHRGPQRPDARRRQADRRPGQPHTGRDPAQERRGVRRAPAPARRRRAGHRPCGRSAARPHPAGHDDRVRRLAHLDARRVRRDRLRHRYVGGGARAGHPDPPAGAPEDHGGDRQRLAARGRHGQGPDPHPDHAAPAPAAVRATSWSTAARPSRSSPWRAG